MTLGKSMSHSALKVVWGKVVVLVASHQAQLTATHHNCALDFLAALLLAVINLSACLISN